MILCVNISVALSPLSDKCQHKPQSELRPAASSSHRQASAETCCRAREREILIAISIKKCFNIQQSALHSTQLSNGPLHV